MSEVQLREYLERLITSEAQRLGEQIDAQERMTALALTSAERAVDKAEAAAKEQLKSHNDLIRQMQTKDALYATQSEVRTVEHNIGDKIEEQKTRFARIESFQAKIVGGLLVIGAIGLSTFIKLFTG